MSESPLEPSHLETGIQTPALNREGEGAGPGGDLLPEVVDAGDLTAGGLGLEVLELVGLLGQARLDLLADLDTLVNVGSNTLKVLLAKTTAGHGRGTNAETARGQGALVAGDGVLIAGNVDGLKDSLDTGTVQVVLAEVEQNHVAVSAVSNELVAELLELVLDSLGVGNDELLVGLEVGGLGLLQGNSEGGDGMVVGATLVTGEDGEVDGVLKVVEGLLAGLGVDGADTLAEEDHGTTGTTEGLVGGGGDDIGVEEGRRNDLSGNKTRDVGHVDNEVGTDGVGNLAHTLVVNETAVGRGTGDKDLGAIQLNVLLELVVVDDAGLEVHSVGHGFKVGGNSRDLPLRSLVTVAQVTTVGKVKTHETAVRRHDGLVNLQVGRASTEALDVDTPLLGVNVEGLESTLLAEELDLVDVLVATIVTGTGVTLGVLVGHGGAKSIEDGAGGDVLGGDEDNGLTLALDLGFHDLSNLRVGVEKGLLKHLLVRRGQRVVRGDGTVGSHYGGCL